MGRWLYFKRGRSPQSDRMSFEQVRDELPLGLAKTITHNMHLIMGYSRAFWIRSPCCIGRACWDLLDVLQVTRRKRRSLYSLWGSFYALQFPHHIFTACNPKPHQSRASTKGKAQGLDGNRQRAAGTRLLHRRQRRQRLLCIRVWEAGKGGSLGLGVLGGVRDSQAESPPPSTSALLFCCCLVAGLGVQPELAQGSSAAPATLHIAVFKREQGVPAWRKVRESL